MTQVEGLLLAPRLPGKPSLALQTVWIPSARLALQAQAVICMGDCQISVQPGEPVRMISSSIPSMLAKTSCRCCTTLCLIFTLKPPKLLVWSVSWQKGLTLPASDLAIHLETGLHSGFQNAYKCLNTSGSEAHVAVPLQAKALAAQS